jgi:hypothetical protein
MLKKLAKLIDVKSIVTLSLTIVLCIITLKQMAVPDLFSNAVMLVLGFFFGKKVTDEDTKGE